MVAKHLLFAGQNVIQNTFSGLFIVKLTHLQLALSDSYVFVDQWITLLASVFLRASH